jgi:queuine tRNA-ribosyltransferase
MGFSVRLTLQHVDAHSAARRARLETRHGAVELPAFMPVGTLGTVKGLTVDMIRATGAAMVLANAYHLALRPGEGVVAALGGLHRFTGWDGPILTDSGGFQLFSLAQSTRVHEAAAVFRSHIDGRVVELSPERCVAIQEALGSDVAMVLDHVVPLPAPAALVEEACERTLRWAVRCREAARREDQAWFAIVQGGLDPALRADSARRLAELDFAGYALGGLSVGESNLDRAAVLEATCPVLPADRPRYLMGVGTPADVLDAIAFGVDMFDCVLPTRNGRNALAFTDQGPLRMRNLVHQEDPRPLEPDCPCPACRHSRSYLRHLFVADEMLGPVLLTAHNLTYYQRLVAGARRAIEEDRFVEYVAQKKRGWRGGCIEKPGGARDN